MNLSLSHVTSKHLANKEFNLQSIARFNVLLGTKFNYMYY